MRADLRWRYGIDLASLDAEEQLDCVAWWYAEGRVSRDH